AWPAVGRPYPLRTVLHLVRFNNSYRIRHFCNPRVLNSLHFLTGTSAGFLRTLAASRPARYATTQVHRNGARPVQGFLEGLTMARQPSAGQGKSVAGRKTTRQIVDHPSGGDGTLRA